MLLTQLSYEGDGTGHNSRIKREKHSSTALAVVSVANPRFTSGLIQDEGTVPRFNHLHGISSLVCRHDFPRAMDWKIWPRVVLTYANMILRLVSVHHRSMLGVRVRWNS